MRMRVRLRRISTFLLLLTIATASQHSQAQIFSCKDSAGRTLTSDRAIPECASRDMREIGRNGVVKRIIPAPLTAEQRHAKQVEEERQKQQADAVLEAHRRDQALLARFKNEGDIDLARQRSLSDLQEKIRQCNLAAALASTQLTNAEAEAARRSDKNRSDKKFVPPSLQQRIDEAKMTIANENKRLQQYRSASLQVDQSFDETLKRYRELNGANTIK